MQTPMWRKGKKKKSLPRHAPGATAQGSTSGLTWGDLADGGRVPAIALVAVGRLNKNSAVTEALCKDLPSNVVEPHASP